MKATNTKGTAKKATTTASKGKTVKAKSSAAEGLRDLFVDSLKDIYWAEKALTKALPKMAKNATSENLITAINEHLAVTEEQVSRLEQVFEIIGEKAAAKKCDAVEGLIKEGESIMEETQEGPVRDAGIIAASQKNRTLRDCNLRNFGSVCNNFGRRASRSIIAADIRRRKRSRYYFNGSCL